MTVTNTTPTSIVPGVPMQASSTSGASAAAAGGSTGSSASSAAGELSSNFNTFLQLLTTQLQNQDPLQPMDSSTFTQQLVEYSQVEQQINTNSDLQSLINLQQANGTNAAVSYLGTNVTITNGDASMQNGEADWAYSLNGDSASTALSVTDSTGKVVYTTPGETAAGVHTFTWNGEDNSGNTLPDGTYKLAVSANAADGTVVATTVQSEGTVSEVDLSGTSPQLVIGAMEVPISQVTLVSN